MEKFHTLRTRIPAYMCDYLLEKGGRVQVWGSWNHWAAPIPASFKTYNYSSVCVFRAYDAKRPHSGKEYCFEAKIPKVCGQHEFKWHVFLPCCGQDIWLLDPDRRIAHNDGWNANSLITFH